MEPVEARLVWAAPSEIRHGQCKKADCTRPTRTFILEGKTVLTESMFCEHHSCYMFTEDVLCQFPRSACSPFCEDHNCVEAGCINERDRGGPRGTDLQRCRDHRCAMEACPGLRLEHGRCEAHTCASVDCRALVPGAGASAGGDAGRFCELHRQCRVQGCDEPVKRRETNGSSRHGDAVLPFCREHACQAPGCGQARPATGDFCPEDRCVVPACRLGRAGPRREGGARGQGSSHDGGTYSFCRQHECKREGCRAQRTHGTTCREHRGCERPECDKPVDANGAGDVCKHHRLGPCYFLDRASELADPCPRLAAPDARFCKTHLCVEPGCRRGLPHARAQYCGLHTCAAVGCLHRRLVDDGGGGGGAFCAAHECRRPGCRDGAAGHEGLCAGHARGFGPEPGRVPAPAPGGERCSVM